MVEYFNPQHTSEHILSLNHTNKGNLHSEIKEKLQRKTKRYQKLRIVGTKKHHGKFPRY